VAAAGSGSAEPVVLGVAAATAGLPAESAAAAAAAGDFAWSRPPTSS
jgi:hypothetical protein